ncbi:MAG TPA: CHAT domain-containing protein, partial [Acidobacteriota bacterium]|nr:CHAT domain-containing protein [Acidobacteriota bacterium]
YLATVDQYYRFNIDLLMRMHQENPSAGHDAEALKVSEQLRARSLLDLLTEGRAEIKRGIASEIAQAELQVRRALSIALENQTRLLNGNQKDPDFPIRKAQAEKEVERRTLEYQDLQIQIRSKHKGYADLQYPQPLGLKEIQKNLLDPDTVLLEYSLGDQQSYLWVATQTSLVSYELPRKAEVGKAAQKVYECLIAPGLEAEFLQGATDPQAQARQKVMFNQYVAQKNAEFPQAAAELSQMIVQPAAALLSRRKRVLIVADGWLQYIPFAALPDPGVPVRKAQPLIVNHEILNLPSASTLSVLQNNLTGRQLAPKKMALLADPVFSPADDRVRAVTSQVSQPVAENLLACPWFSNRGFTLDRLPATRKLAHIVRSLVPPGQYTIALDFGANLNFATSNDLSHFQIVHFATHGMLNSENPDWSGLILSLVDVSGHSVPGFLTTLETFTLNLPAELVVLQGCQTGFGLDPFKTETGKLQSQSITNEGLTGLTRGLMYSGARRVLVTLWNVRDDSSSELMKRFYQKHLHPKNPMPPLAALRAAQLEMRHTPNWKSPYYWAGFLFYGQP